MQHWLQRELLRAPGVGWGRWGQQVHAGAVSDAETRGSVTLNCMTRRGVSRCLDSPSLATASVPSLIASASVWSSGRSGRHSCRLIPPGQFRNPRNVKARIDQVRNESAEFWKLLAVSLYGQPCGLSEILRLNHSSLTAGMKPRAIMISRSTR